MGLYFLLDLKYEPLPITLRNLRNTFEITTLFVPWCCSICELRINSFRLCKGLPSFA
jgi:hypothetical protein